MGPLMVCGSGLGDSYNEYGPSLSSHVQVLKLFMRKQSFYMKDNTRVYSEAKSKLPCARETDSAFLKFHYDNDFTSFL